MKIIRIEIGKLQIPLIRPFITAVRRTEYVEDIITIIKTDCGKTAYGSGAATPLITGDTQESMVYAIKNIIAPKLIGHEITELNTLLHLNETALQKNTSAKAVIDIALHDLFAQKCNIPLYQLLGGHKDSINSCITVSVKNIDEMVKDALTLVNAGFKIIKIKVGLDPIEDIKRIQAIKEALGNDIQLLVDANQGWDVKDAINVINKLEPYTIALIEQPIKAHDLTNLKHIRDNTNSFIVADEACFSPADALTIAKHNIADGINIKLAKAGGIYNANAIYHIAKAANIQLMVGCMLESPVGVAAIASFALSKPDILYADLDPIALIKENYVIGGAKLIGHQITLPNKPGLGIEGFSSGYTFISEVR